VRFRSSIGAIVLIVLGVLFLMSNLGMLPGFHAVLRQWWPLILIIVGVSMLFRT
jgi:hypothetical protein